MGGHFDESLGTLEYSENFVNATIQAGQEVVQQAMTSAEMQTRC